MVFFTRRGSSGDAHVEGIQHTTQAAR